MVSRSPRCAWPALAARPAQAANEGQADLDKATQLKMTANTLTDLSEVIRLAESAMDKGIDKANRPFARSLLASTYIQRGSATAAAIFGGKGPDANWPQYRTLALADLEKGIGMDAKDAQALVLIAKLNLLPQGDAKRAGTALDESVKLSANEPLVHAEALVLRARIRKDVKDKLADFDEAVRMAPTQPAALCARGAIRVAEGKLDAALEDFNNALQLDPKQATALRHRGAIRAAEGKFNAALEDFNRAIELDPKDARDYQSKAEVLVKLKKFDEALAALDKAADLSPDDLKPLLEKAHIDVFQKNVKGGLGELDKALAAAPDNVDVLLLRASVLAELGETGKSLADVERALELKPDLPDALRLRAAILSDAKRFDAALADLERLLRQDPKDELTLLQMGGIYQNQKKFDKAVESIPACSASILRTGCSSAAAATPC